jgi:glycosyltransferase involved in cell wall biosynthesis
VRFACLHHGDPLSEALWSGIPLNIVRTLRELGHEVVPIGELQPQIPFASRVKSAFYRFLLKRVYTLNRDPMVIRSRTPDAERRLKEIGPVDAVLIAYLPDAAYLETGNPIILLHDATWAQLLDYYPGYERKRLAAEIVRGGLTLDKAALERCSHAIYTSSWAAASVAADVGIPPHKVSAAPLGANMIHPPSREDVASCLRQRGHGPMKLFFLGKEWYRKGGDIAVQVATEIQRMGVPVELHVAGCDPEGDIPAFVRRHGFLRKDVQCEVDQLRGLFASSDFFIMPTRADATPVVYAESAAYGLLVMASDTGGVKAMVSGEWGITPEPGASAQVFAAWAVTIYRDRERYERLSWLAREAYERELNWPAFCRHLVQVVKECAR